MRKLLLVTILTGFLTQGFSQDEKEYTDEELTKYATVMVWAEDEKGRMTEVYNSWINDNEDLDAPRFLKLKKANGDSVKLQEIEATDIEVAAYDKILANYDSMTASFKEVYVGKIKEDIGAGLYNTLRADLKSKEELKTRYEAIVEGLKEESEEDDESEE